MDWNDCDWSSVKIVVEGGVIWLVVMQCSVFVCWSDAAQTDGHPPLGELVDALNAASFWPSFFINDVEVIVQMFCKLLIILK